LLTAEPITPWGLCHTTETIFKKGDMREIPESLGLGSVWGENKQYSCLQEIPTIGFQGRQGKGLGETNSVGFLLLACLFVGMFIPTLQMRKLRLKERSARLLPQLVGGRAWV
jgi:hypothetical protein